MRSASISLSLAAILGVAGCKDEKPNPVPPAGPPNSSLGVTSAKPVGTPSSVPTETTATPKVEFTVTVDELAKEAKSNKRGFKGKYDGKFVDLTGKVGYVQAWGNAGFSLRPDDTLQSQYVHIELRKSDQGRLEKMKAASRSQTMVVRGKLQISGELVRIADAELVKVGVTPALPATIAAINAEFSKPEGQKRLTEVLHDIVLRGEVVGHEKNKDSQQIMTVCDPGQPKSKLNAIMLIVDASELKAWSEIKPGTIVILMAEGGFQIDGGQKTPILRSARVLSAVPEGVALSGDAK